MTRALWAIMILSLAQNANAAESNTPSAKALQPVAAESRAAPTTKSTRPAQGSTGSIGRRGAVSERFKEELATCKTLTAEERRSCEREMQAARAQGLYKD